MKRLILFSLMLLFSAVVVFGQEKYKQGLAAMKNGQYEQAITYFNQQKRDPNVSAKTIADCQAQIKECERQIKLKAQRAQDQGATASRKPSNGYDNGHEWVDLGLSVKWATCNVGASSPGDYGRYFACDYGSYFAWGETSSKNNYSWSNYRWCNGSYDNLTRYNTDSSYGTVDNVNLLNSWDDAARANWGGSWRMPTKSEFEELLKNCTRSWTTQGGYRFTSKKNGNSIFLPAAGHRYGAEFNFVGSYGYYWSSSLNSDNPNNAWGLNFGSTSGSMSSSSRLNGFSVRPVTE